jgi:predicted transcriptional regulator
MILRLLWKQGSLTVRQIRDQISARKKLAYTTVLTIVNILVKKGWLTRKRAGKADHYWPVLDEETGKLFILQALAERLFDGSLDELARFAGSTKASAAPPVLAPSTPAPPAASKPETKPVKKPLRSIVQHLDVDLL